MAHPLITATPTISISQISFEHSGTRAIVNTDKPRLSWRFEGNARDWYQSSYNIRIERANGNVEEYHVESAKSNLVPWPSAPLSSCESVRVSVKANGVDGQDTEWAHARVEAALLEQSAWSAQMITALSPTESPLDSPQRPFYVYQDFEIKYLGETARLYATAFGMYDIKINGVPVGDQVLKPGWTSYDHRLYYQVSDVSSMLKVGTNKIVAVVGEGWYSGRIGFAGGTRRLYGDKNGLMVELRVGKETMVKTDQTWKWGNGPILASELYDGEVYDGRLDIDYEGQGAVQILDRPKAFLILDMAPIKRIEERQVEQILTTPSGKRILDFGQNLVGWVRINRGPTGKSPGDRILLTHAEVLEDGELSTRPLRIAKCQDIVICGPDPKALDSWEPTFTYHGFRYVQVDGWADNGNIDKTDFTAIVIHSDMERTGWFKSSHPMINQLHGNVLWSMRGNFVGLPTDCPQRDERLGWTGDLQVFCKTANFLFDTTSLLSGWLQDLASEQAKNDNIPPLVVPDNFRKQFNAEPDPAAVWGDVSVLSPLDVFESSGDPEVLSRQYSSMYSWLKRGIPRDEDGLWGQRTPLDSQFGDWLDPYAPPDFPGDGRTDPYFVANAYLVHVTRKMAEICRVLGKEDEAIGFQADWGRALDVFSNRYVSNAGRTISDSQTALALALHFDLLSTSQRAVAISRLEELVRSNVFKIGTGFAGTPIILDVLANNNRLHLAYRMLQEKQCPSWLYCVSMGATTVWERWDSMRPDGSINPGEMTSFNHYALGAVASFMHSTIGGISPLAPGWKKIRIAPRPGGTVTSAEVAHRSPYGLVRCAWCLEDDKLYLDVTVPPNTTAVVDVGDLQTAIGSGQRQFVVDHRPDPRWPPKPIYKSVTVPLIDEIA
ncbi:alpha-L-rhamnosidase [Cryptococcus neoformans A2-102-5]|nr:alpha-L-rhamnosidase [Cryptococcus neoformans var. grubii D17-1]OXG99888.1 alpha-L-rhamnosidase [Cryptococcus neoformans var. grubii A2-102-5]